jgi:hypothetical protein
LSQPTATAQAAAARRAQDAAAAVKELKLAEYHLEVDLEHDAPLSERRRCACPSVDHSFGEAATPCACCFPSPRYLCCYAFFLQRHQRHAAAAHAFQSALVLHPFGRTGSTILARMLASMARGGVLDKDKDKALYVNNLRTVYALWIKVLGLRPFAGSIEAGPVDSPLSPGGGALTSSPTAAAAAHTLSPSITACELFEVFCKEHGSAVYTLPPPSAGETSADTNAAAAPAAPVVRPVLSGLARVRDYAKGTLNALRAAVQSAVDSFKPEQKNKRGAPFVVAEKINCLCGRPLRGKTCVCCNDFLVQSMLRNVHKMRQKLKLQQKALEGDGFQHHDASSSAGAAALAAASSSNKPTHAPQFGKKRSNDRGRGMRGGGSAGGSRGGTTSGGAPFGAGGTRKPREASSRAKDHHQQQQQQLQLPHQQRQERDGADSDGGSSAKSDEAGGVGAPTRGNSWAHVALKGATVSAPSRTVSSVGAGGKGSLDRSGSIPGGAGAGSGSSASSTPLAASLTSSPMIGPSVAPASGHLPSTLSLAAVQAHAHAHAQQQLQQPVAVGGLSPAAGATAAPSHAGSTAAAPSIAVSLPPQSAWKVAPTVATGPAASSSTAAPISSGGGSITAGPVASAAAAASSAYVPVNAFTTSIPAPSGPASFPLPGGGSSSVTTSAAGAAPPAAPAAAVSSSGVFSPANMISSPFAGVVGGSFPLPPGGSGGIPASQPGMLKSASLVSPTPSMGAGGAAGVFPASPFASLGASGGARPFQPSAGGGSTMLFSPPPLASASGVSPSPSPGAAAAASAQQAAWAGLARHNRTPGSSTPVAGAAGGQNGAGSPALFHRTVSLPGSAQGASKPARK